MGSQPRSSSGLIGALGASKPENFSAVMSNSVPLGLRLGSTENAVVCTELLQDLLARGLTLDDTRAPITIAPMIGQFVRELLASPPSILRLICVSLWNISSLTSSAPVLSALR